MKKQRLALLICAAVLTGQGTPAMAEEYTGPTDFLDSSSDSELELSSNGITDGELIAVLDDWYTISDASSESGWAVLVYDAGKGYGSPWFAVGSEGQKIEAEEGAEIYLCQDGPLQLVWKDPQSGEEVDAGDLFLSYSDDGPSSAALYARYYDWNGEVTGEEELASYNRADGSDYYTDFFPIVDELVSEKGGDVYSTGTQLEAVDENGDAIVYDEDGNELIRYPATAASVITASIHDHMLAVIFQDEFTTEVFNLN